MAGTIVLPLAAFVAMQAAPVAPKPARPSVLLITLDTTRADALGCYGAPKWVTPNLDALAARGVRFATARAAAPVTLPAHSSLFTGLFPFQHGVRDNGTFVLSDAAHTLAERLKEAGYATAAVPGAYVVDSSFGLAQGFDAYFDLPQDALAQGGGEAERSAAEVIDRATAWLAQAPTDRPFFLWTHFFDAHFPYQPAADLQAAHPITTDPAKPKGAQKRAELDQLYRLEVAGIDRALPRLFAALDRFGGAGAVVIAVAGDHGEALGEHGESTHAALVHDATLRVPFLLAGAALPQGKVVEPAVTMVDFAPTLLALLGLPAEGTAGADLGPLLRGEAWTPTRPLYAETCSSWFTYGWRPLFTLVEGKWKVVFGERAQLFDLDNDAGEKRDVAADHDDVVEAAREHLRGLAEQTLAAARHTPDANDQEKLKTLGYLIDANSAKRGGLVPPGWQPKEALTPEAGLKNQRRYTHANQLWQEGARDAALAELKQLTQDEPENSHYASTAAVLLLNAGRAAEALPLAKVAVELAESGPTRLTLVACLTALARNDEALQEAATTVALFPKLLPAKLTYGELLVGKGRGAEAVAPLEAFLKAFTGDAATRTKAEQLLARARAAGR